MNHIQFRPSPTHKEALLERGNESKRHAVSKRDLERYYEVLEQSLAEIQETFNLNELVFMADVVKGGVNDIALFWAQIADSKADDVDVNELSDEVRRLRYAQATALVDALERWLHDDEREATPAGFAHVGLLTINPHG